MKTPQVILEWACDGIGCARHVQLVIPETVSTDLLAQKMIQRLAEDAGCRFLGRSTFFCPRCADPRRRAPECLGGEPAKALPPTLEGEQ